MIIVRLDRMLAHRKMTSLELSEKIGMTPVMISRIKMGQTPSIRFDTLEKICLALDCDICDILELESKPHPLEPKKTPLWPGVAGDD